MDDIRDLSVVVLITIRNNRKHYQYSQIRLQCSSAYLYANYDIFLSPEELFTAALRNGKNLKFAGLFANTQTSGTSYKQVKKEKCNVRNNGSLSLTPASTRSIRECSDVETDQYWSHTFEISR